jgi:hypothetical protein
MLSTREPHSEEVFTRCDQEASVRAEKRWRKKVAELGFQGSE